mgnify:CR=1 FL=1
MKHLRSLLLFLTIALALSAVSVYYIFFAPFGKGTTAQYIYIDKDDTKDSIIHKLSIVAPRQTWGIEWLWEMTEAQTQEMNDYCRRYAAFMDAAKTEREATLWAVDTAEKHGFKPLTAGMTLNPGDKVYYNNRNFNRRRNLHCNCK